MSNPINQGIVLTAVGEALLNNAGIAGKDLQLTQFSIGDGGSLDYNPTYDQLRALTAIPGEWDRRNLSNVYPNPEGAGYIVEAVQPHDVGYEKWCVIVGYWTVDNKLFAVHLVPKWQKPKAGSPTLSELPIRAYFVHSSSAAIVLAVNPSTVVATRNWVEAAFISRTDFDAQRSLLLSKSEFDNEIRKRTLADLTDSATAPEEGTLMFKKHGDKKLQLSDNGKMLVVFVARSVDLSAGKCRLVAPDGELIETENGSFLFVNLGDKGPFGFVRDGIWRQM